MIFLSTVVSSIAPNYFETINAVSNPRFSSLHYDKAIFDHAHHHLEHFHTLFSFPFVYFALPSVHSFYSGRCRLKARRI